MATVDMIDEDPHNQLCWNLQFLSRKDHSIKKNTLEKRGGQGRNRSRSSRLVATNVGTGERVVFESIRAASRETTCTQKGISKALANRTEYQVKEKIKSKGGEGGGL